MAILTPPTPPLPQVKAKMYDIPSIHKAASTGQLFQHSTPSSPQAAGEATAGDESLHHPSSDGRAAGAGRGHDVRGTGQLLERYNTCPSVLEPQALASANKT